MCTTRGRGMPFCFGFRQGLRVVRVTPAVNLCSGPKRREQIVSVGIELSASDGRQRTHPDAPASSHAGGTTAIPNGA